MTAATDTGRRRGGRGLVRSPGTKAGFMNVSRVSGGGEGEDARNTFVARAEAGPFVPGLN
ncbi:hypothetical protein GCM10010151_34250 [Actinoallomurus spadix]|uniref:Uncharacterized protein n=1 Tax=Actinoallomurus spadix TaxID=79912 RepID=A0ABP3GC40_9ACTN